MTEINASFFLAVAAAYGCVCLVWLLARRVIGESWPTEDVPETDRKWLDLGLLVVAVLAAFGIGALYRRDLLLPSVSGPWGLLTTSVNLCLPFVPLLLIVLWRRQSFRTVMLSSTAFWYKLGVGCAAALVGALVYLGLVGESGQAPSVIRESCSLYSLAHAPAVFLEGVALAFAYDRLRWVAGGKASIWLPCLLFAAAHVPRSLAAGRPPHEVAVWFVFNTLLPVMILSVVVKSRDVIWIAIPHYVLDVAIKAFE